MTSTNLIDLRHAHKPSTDDLSGLQAYLAQLVGEPFRFARVSYGDELTLHFGDLRPARSPKLKNYLYGAYVLGLRGSPWVLKSGSEPLVLSAGVLFQPLPPSIGKPLEKTELESKRFIEADSLVLSATPFVVKPVDGFGLQLRMSDGSTLLVVPSIQDPEAPGEEVLPELADWELLSPRGLLSVGPGFKWAFESSGGSAAGEDASSMGRDKMGFRFVGGPLDGQRFDHTQINAIASSIVPLFTESGNRQFLLMPPLDECNRILRGELTKEQTQGPMYPYERVFTPEGVEYHDAGNGRFDNALKQSNQPLSEEAQARKKLFGEFADRFIQKLRTTELTSATEVNLLYLCVDREGKPVPSIRISITPKTTVQFPGDQQEARTFAAAMHLDSMIANVNSLVRNAPTGYFSFAEQPPVAVQIRGFELEIEQPSSPALNQALQLAEPAAKRVRVA